MIQKIAIKMLGDFSVVADGRCVVDATAKLTKPWQLFCYLALNREHVTPSSVLLQELWGGEELADLARENPNLTYIRAITRDRPQREGDIQGRFDCDGVLGFMRKHTPQPSGVFVCGSNDFVEALAGCFVGAGIPAERVKTERFGG